MSGVRRHAIPGREMDEAAIRKGDAFKQLTPMEQVLERPGMWIGSTAIEPTTMSCFDGASVRRKVIPDYIQGIDKLYSELISNAIDNCTYSIVYGRDPHEISVTLTPTTITIENGGCNVPVVKMANGVWIPDMLWGSLFSSSHYAEACKSYKASSGAGGCNGVGAALVNIFSDSFDVLVEDPESQKRYHQIWSRGKPVIIDGVPREPKITSSKKIVNTKIRVTFILNFSYFGSEKYSALMLELFAFHAITASFTAKVPVTIIDDLNVARRYDLRMIGDYAALFPELKPSPSIKRLEWCALSEDAVKKGLTYAAVVKGHVEIPRIEVLLVDELGEDATPQPAEDEPLVAKKSRAKKPARVTSKRATGAYQLSFVNGINTTQHGVHVNELVDAFFGAILTELKISTIHGKRHISFLLSVRLDSPQFGGQYKSTLSKPKPVFGEIAPVILRGLRSWKTMDRLKALNDAELTAGLKKTDGKKLRRLTQITELDDANYAGTPASHTCTLIIVEGGSAATYPEMLRDMIPNGRDTHGILTLRGKPLNVMNASIAQLSGETGSQVYTNFKQAIGLQDGMDYVSTANFKKLRYGHVWIATDADCDGWHILCLLLLMFHERFPSLVNRGFISYLRTPVLRVPGARGLTFFTKRAYLEWREKALAAGGTEAVMAKRTPRYFKGLGGSDDKDVKEDYESKRGRLSINDDDGQGKEALSLGFDKKRTGDRKTWVAVPVAGEFLDTDAAMEGISHFIHTGLKLYSLDNIQRAIPSIMDGGKESMRKALSAAIQKFGLKSGDRHAGLTAEERKAMGLKSVKSAAYTVPPNAKVLQITGSTTEHFCYHHGELILGHVISNMCKTYIGANNEAWFQPVSSFGTIDSGKAPDPRYATLGPAWWWSYVYSTADVNLVDYVYDEGKKCEPKFLLPVVCWALCNQADGVGTGYSTRIPGHNIEEVAMAHLCLLEGRTRFPKLIPWWRGFRGTVRLLPRTTARKMIVIEKSVDVEDIEGDEDMGDSVDVEDEDPETRKKVKQLVSEDQALAGSEKEDPMVCVVDGTYTIEGNNVIVTSLPLRTFKEFSAILANLIEKKIVSDFRNRSVGDNIRFEIEMVVDETTGKLPGGNLMKIFRLRKMIAMSNLVLLDENGLPKRYKSSEAILEYFHSKRLDFYEKRRNAIVEALKAKLFNLECKMQLITLLTSEEEDKIVYEKRDEEDILAEITVKLPHVPHEIYRELNVRHLNKNQIGKLNELITAAKAELEALESTTKEAMWKRDLLAFLKEYRAIYGGKNVSDSYKDLPW